MMSDATSLTTIAETNTIGLDKASFIFEAVPTHAQPSLCEDSRLLHSEQISQLSVKTARQHIKFCCSMVCPHRLFVQGNLRAVSL